MSQLTKDLEAVRMLFRQDRLVKRWGYIAITKAPKTPILPQDDSKLIETMFKSLEKTNGRIALVYLDLNHPEQSDLWGSAVRDCFDDIAGIIVFSQQEILGNVVIDPIELYDFLESRNSIESRAEFFFSRLPKEFFYADLPIIFDESNGVLTRFSPTSDHITSDRLSFRQPGKYPDDYYAFSCGRNIYSYDKTHTPFLWNSLCPTVNILNEDEAKGILESCRLSRLSDCARNIYRDFYNVAEIQPQDPSGVNIADVNKALDAMQDALPDCFDEEIVEMLRSYDQEIEKTRDVLRTPSYISLIKKEEYPEYAVFEEKMTRFENAAELCWIVVSHTPKYYREDTKTDALGWDGFKEACTNTGLEHQIKASNSGVPIEDILA